MACDHIRPLSSLAVSSNKTAARPVSVFGCADSSTLACGVANCAIYPHSSINWSSAC
jgi:hypothetical protein